MTPSAIDTRYGVPSDTLRERPSSWPRGLLVWLLLITGCLLVAVALVAIWVNTLLLDDDAYVDTIGPLATDSAVQAEITTVATDRIMAALDLGFGAGTAERTVRSAVGSFVSSDAFPDVWREANRAAHVQVKGLIAGKEGDGFGSRDGEVYLELGPIATAIANQLVPFGIDLSRVTALAGDVEFQILKTDDIEAIQRTVRQIDQAAFWFPALAAVAFLGAIVISPHRLRTIGRMGVGLIVSGGIVLIAVAVIFRLYKNRTADTGSNVVADRLFELMVDPLQTAALGLMAVATVLAIATFAGDLIAARFRRFRTHSTESSPSGIRVQ